MKFNIAITTGNDVPTTTDADHASARRVAAFASTLSMLVPMAMRYIEKLTTDKPSTSSSAKPTAEPTAEP